MLAIAAKGVRVLKTLFCPPWIHSPVDVSFNLLYALPHGIGSLTSLVVLRLAYNDLELSSMTLDTLQVDCPPPLPPRSPHSCCCAFCAPGSISDVLGGDIYCPLPATRPWPPLDAPGSSGKRGLNVRPLQPPPCACEWQNLEELLLTSNRYDPACSDARVRPVPFGVPASPGKYGIMGLRGQGDMMRMRCFSEQRW